MKEKKRSKREKKKGKKREEEEQKLNKTKTVDLSACSRFVIQLCLVLALVLCVFLRLRRVINLSQATKFIFFKNGEN